MDGFFSWVSDVFEDPEAQGRSAANSPLVVSNKVHSPSSRLCGLTFFFLFLLFLERSPARCV